jgi:hypothetical protein
MFEYYDGITRKKRKLLNYYPKKSVRNRQTNKEDVTQVAKFKKM